MSEFGITIYVEDNAFLQAKRFELAKLIREKIEALKGKVNASPEVSVVTSKGGIDIISRSKGQAVIEMIKMLKLRKVVLIADAVGTRDNPGNDRSMFEITEKDLQDAGIDWKVDLIKVYVGSEKALDLPEGVIVAPRGKKETDAALNLYLAIQKAKDRHGVSHVRKAHPAGEAPDIIVGLPEGALGQNAIDMVLEKNPGVGFVQLSRGVPEEEKLRELEKVSKTVGAKASAFIDSESLLSSSQEEVIAVISDFVDKVRTDIFDLLHPEISSVGLDALGKYTKKHLKEVANLLIDGIPVIENFKLNEKSIYDLRINNLHRSIFSGVTLSENANNFLAQAPEQGRPSYISVLARTAADLRFIANAIGDMGIDRKKASSMIQVRVLNKDITQENIAHYINATGIADVLDSRNIVPITEEGLSIQHTLSLAKGLFGEGIKDSQVAIGDIIDPNNPVKDLDILARKEAPLYVQMAQEGIASQLLMAVIEIIANKGKIDKSLGSINKKNNNWYIYLPNMEAVDLNILRQEIESYRQVLIKA